MTRVFNLVNFNSISNSIQSDCSINKYSAEWERIFLFCCMRLLLWGNSPYGINQTRVHTYFTMVFHYDHLFSINYTKLEAISKDCTNNTYKFLEKVKVESQVSLPSQFTTESIPCLQIKLQLRLLMENWNDKE